MNIRKIDSITVLKGSSTGVGSRLKTLNTRREIEDTLCKLGWTPPNEEKVENLCEDCGKPLGQFHICGPFTKKEYEAMLKKRRERRPVSDKKEDLSSIEKGLLATSPCIGGGVIKVFSGKPPELEETPPSFKAIHEAFRTLTHAVHANAVEHGWFDTEMPNKEMEFLVGMAGVMKECGEALEVVSARQWDALDEKCPQHTKLSVELADVVLRLLTLCGRHNINIGAAITAKHAYNRSRPYRHGGKAF